MPPRPKKSSKRRPVPEVDVPPPWESMDSGDEQLAREGYLALRRRSGLPPVRLANEPMMAARERCGGRPMNVWALVRFDPDRALARRVLIGAVDYERECMVGSRRWAGVDPVDRPEPTRPADPPNNNFAPFSRAALPSPGTRRRLIVAVEGEEAVAEATRRRATAALADLAAKAATVGLRVTDDDVLETENGSVR